MDVQHDRVTIGCCHLRDLDHVPRVFRLLQGERQNDYRVVLIQRSCQHFFVALESGTFAELIPVRFKLAGR